jgi:DnaJ family protein C protein 28
MPNSSIEEIIRRAIEKGEFDDLPGKGKPLHIEQNPHQDPDWRSAHNILKSSGFTLPWIESLREIGTILQQARDRLSRAWSWRNDRQGHNLQTEFVESEWTKANKNFQERIASVNHQIRAHNLEVPNDRFQLPLVNADQEIERIIRNSEP